MVHTSFILSKMVSASVDEPVSMRPSTRYDFRGKGVVMCTVYISSWPLRRMRVLDEWTWPKRQIILWRQMPLPLQYVMSWKRSGLGFDMMVDCIAPVGERRDNIYIYVLLTGKYKIPEKAIVEDCKGNWAANDEPQKEIVNFVLSRWCEFGRVASRTGPGLTQCLLNTRLFGRFVGSWSWRWCIFRVFFKFGHRDTVAIHFRDLSLFVAQFLLHIVR